MGKMVVPVVFLVVSLLALAACGDARYVDRETLARVDLFHIEDEEAPTGRYESEAATGVGKYERATFDLFVNGFGADELVGNFYKISGNVETFSEFGDGTEFMIMSVDYGFLAVAMVAVEKGWDKIEVGDVITVFFQYMGFLDYDDYLSGYGDMPLGSYEYFEYFVSG